MESKDLHLTVIHCPEHCITVNDRIAINGILMCYGTDWFLGKDKIIIIVDTISPIIASDHFCAMQGVTKLVYISKRISSLDVSKEGNPRYLLTDWSTQTIL